MNAASRAQIKLGGSLLAWDPEEQIITARDMAARGIEVHADVIDASFSTKNGVSARVLRLLAAEFGTCLDVHLMARDPTAAIMALPPSPFDRLTVHVRARMWAQTLRPLPRQRARSFWLSIDPSDWTGDRGTANLVAMLDAQEPDGILIMLTPAGVPGRSAQLEALKSDVWNLATRYGPIGVDGGVSVGNLSSVVEAGARYAVVGRSLVMLAG